MMTAMNRWVCRKIVKETATQNVEGERVGVFNRAFGYVYHIRLAGKRLKARNRTVYYFVKYSLCIAILGLIVASAL